MKVNKHDIKHQCRWSTDRANGVRTVQQSNDSQLLGSAEYATSSYPSIKSLMMRSCVLDPVRLDAVNCGFLGYLSGTQDVVEVPSPSYLKVPSHYFEEELFGAISLANPFLSQCPSNLIWIY